MQHERLCTGCQTIYMTEKEGSAYCPDCCKAKGWGSVLHQIPKKRDGYEFLKEFPPDEPVVDMCVHNDSVYIATAKRIYQVRQNKVVPLDLAIEKVKE